MTADKSQRERIRELLVHFTNGTDRSDDTVAQLGVLVDQAFPEDDVMQDLKIACAMYRRTGGELLYDEQTLLPICERSLRYLDKI